jgi:hypothetical protein
VAPNQSSKAGRKRVSGATLALLGLVGALLVGIAAVFAHALLSPELRGARWTGGSPVLTGMIVLGAVGAGGLTAVLMGLAFYSDRKGYDDPPRVDPPADAD